MRTDIALIDQELTARLPLLEQVLPPQLSPERLKRTVLIAVERNPRLLDCTPASIINAATSAAVLGLEVDTASGQGFIIPFKNTAQFVIGYKGLNTLAARAGFTITGAVVREGDVFDYELGSGAFVRHKPDLVDVARRRIVAAWACAERTGHPPIVVVMALEELLAVKDRAPGARKSDSPWNDATGPGFAAMCEKTAKRRLARSLPLSVFSQADQLERAVDDGKPAHIDIDGVVHVAEGPEARGDVAPQPEQTDLTKPARGIAFPAVRTWSNLADYSRPFLADASPEEARAWLEHFSTRLEAGKASPKAGVREMVGELLELHDKAISQEAPTDGR